MTITRAHAEQVLTRRLGAILTAAGLDGESGAGTNPDLNDPLGWALRQIGKSVAVITAVSDTDMTGVSTSEVDKFLDLAELRALETVSLSLSVYVDISIGPRRESLSQMNAGIERRIEAKKKQIAQDYGIGGAVIYAGTIEQDFIEAEPEAEE